MNDRIPTLRPWLVPGLFLAGAAMALFAAHAKAQSLPRTYTAIVAGKNGGTVSRSQEFITFIK